MQTIRWYRWLALGVMLVPITARCQGPQPIVKEIATIPGVAIATAARMPNGQIVIVGFGDSLVAFDPASKRMTTITRNWDYDLAISPKGNRIAYTSSNSAGDDFVWSIPVDPTTGTPRGAAQRVSLRPSDTPSFSPDGQSLAITIWHGNGSDVTVIPSTGGLARILITTDHGVEGLSWSTEGTAVFATLATSRDSTARTILRLSLAPKKVDTVMTFPRSAGVAGSIQGAIVFVRPDASAVTDGNLSYVTSAGTHGAFSIPPGSIPDFSGQSSRTILTTATRVGELRLVDVATGKARTITAPSIVPNSIRWSSDGSRFAALLADPTLRPRAAVIVMNADGSGQRQYDAPATGGLQLSPQGDVLAIGTLRGTKIGLLDLASGKLRTLNGPEMSLMGMHWRSDGKAIFAEARFPVPGSAAPHLGVASVGLDGRTIFMRDISAEYPNAMRADPFNDSLAVVFGGGKMSPRFAVVPMAGGRAIPMELAPLNGGNASRPSDAHNGSPLIEHVTSSDGVSMLNFYSLTGHLTRQIQLPFTHIQGSVVPFADGAHALVAAQMAGDTALRYYVAPFSSEPPRLLTDVPRAILSFSLSPDGKHLVYIQVVAKETRIDAVDFTPVLRAAGIH